MRRRALVYRQIFRTGTSYRLYESSAARGLWFRDEFLRTRTRAGTADGADSRTASTDVFGVGPATLTLDGTWVTRVPLLGPLERFYGVADDVAVTGQCRAAAGAADGCAQTTPPTRRTPRRPQTRLTAPPGGQLRAW